MTHEEQIAEAARRVRIQGLVKYGKEAFEGATDEEVEAAKAEYARWEANAAETQRAQIAAQRVREG
jgi:hypothetical protein